MTPKQMNRALRKWGISIVFNKTKNRWYAGDCEGEVRYGRLEVDALNYAARRTDVTHSGILPEDAVEDYCNARNLEWDV